MSAYIMHECHLIPVEIGPDYVDNRGTRRVIVYAATPIFPTWTHGGWDYSTAITVTLDQLIVLRGNTRCYSQYSTTHAQADNFEASR
jgi:hypothetical protein